MWRAVFRWHFQPVHCVPPARLPGAGLTLCTLRLTKGPWPFSSIQARVCKFSRVVLATLLSG